MKVCWVPPLWLVRQKIMQFGILIFLEAEEINLRGNLKGSKCDEYFYFYNFFGFIKKVIFPLDPVGFFEIFLPDT